MMVTTALKTLGQKRPVCYALPSLREAADAHEQCGHQTQIPGAVNYFEQCLGTPSAVQDVTNPSLASFQEWLAEEKKVSKKSARDLADGVRSIVNRIAPGNLPHGNADRVLLFDAEQLDTIENVLVNQYFPPRIKIANKKTELQYKYAVSRLAKYLGRSATLDDLNDQTIGGYMRYMRDEGLAARSING